MINLFWKIRLTLMLWNTWKFWNWRKEQQIWLSLSAAWEVAGVCYDDRPPEKPSEKAIAIWSGLELIENGERDRKC